jgi:hypothetical protein
MIDAAIREALDCSDRLIHNRWNVIPNDDLREFAILCVIG